MPSSVVSKFYDKNVNNIESYWYDFIHCQFDWIIQELSQRYSANDVFSVIDLGCGTGALLERILEAFPFALVTGIDLSQAMILRAKTRLNGKGDIIQDNLNNLKINYSQYDVVISTTVLHHLENPLDMLQTMRKMAKSDGNVYLSEFAIDTVPLRLANLYWKIFMPGHRQTWSTPEMKSLISDAELKIVDHTVLKPSWFWRIQIYELS